VGSTFTVRTTNATVGSTGLLAWASSAADSVTKALSARVDGRNSDAIVARQAAATSGAGAALRAIGGKNDGAVVTTDALARTALTVSGPGRGISVTSTAFGVVSVRVEPTGAGSEGIRAFGGRFAVHGVHTEASGAAIYGEGINGVRGVTTGAGYGLYGRNDLESGYGLYCEGKARVTGDLQVDGSVVQPAAGFTIDDPAAPKGSILRHAFVASSEHLTTYSGNVDLDASGSAEVVLPDWFASLNDDEVRYQLTTVGQYAPVFVAKRLRNGRFRIAGGSRGLTVSWQITATRRDAWAEGHRLAVQSAKPSDQVGHYLDPRSHGRRLDESIGWIDADDDAVSTPED
jgi:hypothetical protein